MIKVSNIIKTAFSANDAEKISQEIEKVFNNEKIIVDFSDITIFTTLFFNNVFAKYLIEFGPENYNNKFQLINLSELGKTTYKHSYDNAISYYNLSEEDRKKQDEELNTPDD